MKEFKPEDILVQDVDLKIITSLPNSFLEDKVVLGIDIYKYSQYPPVEQIYIPVIFERLYYMAVKNVRDHEGYFFEEYCKDFKEFKTKFISTGDGGFQIFDNVMQALIFVTYFQAGLKRFCTGGSKATLDKNLYKIVNSMELRYAISLDKIYSYKSNFYGPAIINNARILSKDSLNRLLIDLNTITWLNTNINSPENLLDLDKEGLSKTNYFKKYDKTKNTHLFNTTGKVLSVDIQKVGTLKAKETILDVFNMHLQARLDMNVGHQDYKIYVITIGNLNTSGINT